MFILYNHIISGGTLWKRYTYYIIAIRIVDTEYGANFKEIYKYVITNTNFFFRSFD